MIKVICIGHNYEYEIRELLKNFFKPKEIEIKYIPYMQYNKNLNNLKDLESTIVSILSINNDKIIVASKLNNKEEVIEEKIYDKNDLEIKKVSKRLIKKSIFKLIQKNRNVKVPWGILTGIRPTKIVHELLEKGTSEKDILYILKNKYCVENSKANLLINIAKTEHKFVYPIDESKISIYISIPFCPTRCIYCSFPSNPLNQTSHLVGDYVKILCKEVREVGELIKDAGKTVQTIYIGGGTPTTLSVKEFDTLFKTINENINLHDLEEFTVEAGRPDTIDYEKLKFLKESNITRLSINPQSMNDSTLKKIGRDHTVKELIDSYKLATQVGFKNINMDIIVGLPGENTEMIRYTMDEIKKLNPTNLTVHTLAIKRASRLREQEKEFSSVEANEVIDMLNITKDYAEKMGLKPYYMYRQKHMVGNLENIGYAKLGYECIYNIQIMEEKQSIIALGAGAASKFTYPAENRLERVPNVKGLGHYINRVDEMIERKRKFLIDNI